MTISWRALLGHAAVQAENVDEQAVDELFRTHYADLLGLARCLLDDRRLSEDAALEAFAWLARDRKPLDDPGVALRHLASAVIRGCRSRARRLEQERALDPLQAVDLLRLGAVDAGLPDTDPDAPAAPGDPSEPGAALRRLPHRQREVVVCRYHLGLSSAETSDLLGITPGTARRRHRRAVRSRSAFETADSVERRIREDLRALAGTSVTDADVERGHERLAVLLRGVSLRSRSRSLL